MSDINKMDFKQLRNEVQLLRDELAIMKRKYEDIIYNLDDSNFSGQFIKEKNDMKTKIEVTAEGIKTKVSNADLKNSLAEYTTLEQTSNAIKTQAYASADLSSAKQITDLKQATDITKTYFIEDVNGNKAYYYYNQISKEWEEIVGGGIDTVFEQTPTGFKLKGNVKVDGSCVLTDSLTFDSSDNPLQVEYSVDGTNNWHTTFVSGSDKFMRLKIGSKWSDAMKVVGSDGTQGPPGDSADIDPWAVFDMLTNNGDNQGLFSAFYDDGNKLFINAEFIRAGTLSADYIDTEDLSCTRLYAKGNINGYSVRLNGNLGDFGIFNGSAYDNETSAGTNCMYGVYNSFPNVNFYIYGENYMGYDVDSSTVWAKGNWDFSTANVNGIEGGSGGSGGVAVFG